MKSLDPIHNRASMADRGKKPEEIEIHGAEARRHGLHVFWETSGLVGVRSQFPERLIELDGGNLIIHPKTRNKTKTKNKVLVTA